MSVTGHNPVRRADDYYATPAWCTRAILRHLPKFRRAFDPCAGEGAILKEVANVYGALVEVSGMEIDGDRARKAGVPQGDALKTDWSSKGKPAPDLVITNPPYKHAMEFVERAREEVILGGTVAMLLRLPWLASQKRAAFLRANTPSVYVLPKRPSFTGKGTDATDYAWFVWEPIGPATVTILDV